MYGTKPINSNIVLDHRAFCYLVVYQATKDPRFTHALIHSAVVIIWHKRLQRIFLIIIILKKQRKLPVRDIL